MLRKLLVLLTVLAIALPAAAGRVVLFDQAHGQRFLPDDRASLGLKSFADGFTRAGFELNVQKAPITPESLQGVTTFVTSGAFAPFSAEEIQAVRGYVEQGGTLVVALHIGPPLGGLLNAFGVVSSPGVLHEQENLLTDTGLDFAVKKFRPHRLFAGMAEFHLYGGWALLGGDQVAAVAYTGPSAWIDVDHDRQRHPEGEPQHTFAVVCAGLVGKGKVAVFGDDAIFQNRFIQHPGNQQLLENLVAWVGGLE